MTSQIISAVLQAAVGLAMMIAAALFAAGCSALPVSTQTPVVNVTCSWNATEGAMVEDNDCLIDRATSGGEQDSTGNRIDSQVEADVSVPVSGL